VDPTKLAQANRFKVELDDGDIKDLGMWQKVDGLAVTLKTKPVKAGGNYDYVMHLPDRVEYPKITLTRAIDQSDSARVQRYLSKQSRELKGNGVTISVYDHHYTSPLMSWSLRNAKPTEWKCITLDAGGSKVAVETLSFVHEGFL
jgi:phage tail-like protein